MPRLLRVLLALGLALGLAVALPGSGLVPGPTAPAAAAECPASGGAAMPRGVGVGRRRVPRRRVGARPGHEPVRRAGRGPAGLLVRPDPAPLLHRHRGACGGDAGHRAAADARRRLPGRRGRRGRAARLAARGLHRPDARGPGRRRVPAAAAAGAHWQLRLDDDRHPVRAPRPRRHAEGRRVAGRLGDAGAPARAGRHGGPPHDLARVEHLPRPLAALGLDPVHPRRRADRRRPDDRGVGRRGRRWTSTCGASPRSRRPSRRRR